MAEQLKAIKGMNDILPPGVGKMGVAPGTMRALMRRYDIKMSASDCWSPPRCLCAV